MLQLQVLTYLPPTVTSPLCLEQPPNFYSLPSNQVTMHISAACSKLALARSSTSVCLSPPQSANLSYSSILSFLSLFLHLLMLHIPFNTLIKPHPQAGPPRGLRGPRANTKIGPPQNGRVRGSGGKPPEYFTCHEVCSGGSRGSFLCMHTVQIYLQAAVFD